MKKIFDEDNEYIREIGRLSILGAEYENRYMESKYLKVRKKSPLIKSIEEEMYSRNIKQKELADMLDINEPMDIKIQYSLLNASNRSSKTAY